MLISDYYKDQIRQFHVKNPAWGSNGAKYREKVITLCKSYNSLDILDYGCGTGELAKSLGFPVKEYDPGIPGKDSPAIPANIVVCTDVLEHVEPEYVDATLLDLKRCLKETGFFVIYTANAPDWLPDGRNAHLSRHDWFWWVEKIREHFIIVEMLVMPWNMVFTVVKKDGRKLIIYNPHTKEILNPSE